jgi:FkbM family methyltransferase
MTNLINLERDWTANNTSTTDYVIAYVNFVRNKVITFNLYRRAFKNYLSILSRIVKKRYPIVAVLRNDNNSVVLQTETAIALVAYAQIYKDIKLDMAKKQITIPFFHSEKNGTVCLRFLGGMEGGDIVHIFFRHIYRQLPIKGKTVIDIGTQIGDSAVYFSIQGAKKVIAIEPLSTNYEIARENILLNGISHDISLIWAACGAETKYHHDALTLKGIPVLTLEDILKKNITDENERLILKMDCEGFEYPIILTARDEVLRRFSHMQIEYHSGYVDLKNKLEKSGFRVSIGRPTAFRLSDSGQRSMLSGYRPGQWQLTGYLYAESN